MKKVLFLTLVIAFSTSVSAQITTSVKASDLKKQGLELVSKESPNLEAQIKDALMKDEGLQTETINYLKSNPETTKAMAGMAKSGNVSNRGIIKSILGDKDLSTVAIDYISNNPKLLSKAMKLIGM